MRRFRVITLAATAAAAFFVGVSPAHAAECGMGFEATIDLNAPNHPDPNRSASDIDADTLIGSSNDNVLKGKGGNDTLKGKGGTDTCDGGDGANDSAAASCETVLGVP